MLGPIVSPPLAAPRPRWAVLIVAPLVIAAAIVMTTRRAGDLHASRFDIDAYARLHRLWVADHGPGCARSMAHLADYAPEHRILDPWGSELRLLCMRLGGSESEILVDVTSNGPDRIANTDDDFTGRDYFAAGPLPGAAEPAATERTLEMIRVAGMDYLAGHRACFHTADDLHLGQLRDAWNNAIAVDCVGSTVTAISPGPDRVAGTEDDLSTADTYD